MRYALLLSLVLTLRPSSAHALTLHYAYESEWFSWSAQGPDQVERRGTLHRNFGAWKPKPYVC